MMFNKYLYKCWMTFKVQSYIKTSGCVVCFFFHGLVFSLVTLLLFRFPRGEHRALGVL